MTHTPVGQSVDRIRGIAVVLALVHMRVGDHAKTKQAPAERVGVRWSWMTSNLSRGERPIPHMKIPYPPDPDYVSQESKRNL